MTQTVLALLSMGFGLGMLHALDADHIMAVSVLSSKENQRPLLWRTLQFCGQWAIGHGVTMLVLASVLLFWSVQLTPIWITAAEKVIGVVLIALGLWILWQFVQQKWLLKAHSHDSLVHVHLAKAHIKSHDHSPILVGMTHGIAGSAPVLALLPIIQQEQHLSVQFALLYVLFFSAGVLATMLVFGLGFGQLQQWLARVSQRVFVFSRLLMAGISISFGIFWLMAS